MFYHCTTPPTVDETRARMFTVYITIICNFNQERINIPLHAVFTRFLETYDINVNISLRITDNPSVVVIKIL